MTGTVFFLAMMVMAGIGTCVAPFLPQRGSVIGGAFTVYLVATAWMAVRRAAGTVFGFQASRAASGMLDGSPAVAYWVLAAIAALADVRRALDHRHLVLSGAGAGVSGGDSGFMGPSCAGDRRLGDIGFLDVPPAVVEIDWWG